MFIKEFLDSRDVCPICQSDLEITMDTDRVKNTQFKLIDDMLWFHNSNTDKFSSNYKPFFDYSIDINTNKTEPYGGSGANLNNFDFQGGKFNFKLSLFCPIHNSLDINLYECSYHFKIINGVVDVEDIVETLKTDKFGIVSSYTFNKINYIDLISASMIALPYFDISHLSLTKIREKLKTYLLLS